MPKMISHYPIPLDGNDRQTLRLPADGEILGVDPTLSWMASHIVPNTADTAHYQARSSINDRLLCLHVLHEVPVVNWQDRYFGVSASCTTVPDDIVEYLGVCQVPWAAEHSHVFELADGPPWCDRDERDAAPIRREPTCLDRLLAWLRSLLG